MGILHNKVLLVSDFCTASSGNSIALTGKNSKRMQKRSFRFFLLFSINKR